MSKIKTILEYAKAHVYKIKNLSEFFAYRFKVRGKKVNEYAQKTVLFDTQGLTINRRLAQVVLQFSDIGYTCLTKISLRDYLATSNEDYSDIVLRNSKPYKGQKYEILVCGRGNNSSCKQIVFDDNIKSFPEHINEKFFYPLIFHPKKILNNSEQYIQNLYEKSKDLRIGVVFIGNTNFNSYNSFKENIHNDYGMFTRLEVLEYIKTNFKDKIFRPGTREEFDLKYNDCKKPLKDKIVIIDQIRISGEEYFDILYNSKYHLWTCGDAFPYCHNQVEGIACGAIPICETFKGKPLYNDMKNGINCLTFNKLEELDDIIKSVLRDKESSNSISENAVRNVFLHNFSANAFEKKVVEFTESDIEEEKYYIHPKMYK